MFADMNKAFLKRSLNFGGDSATGSITSFLRRFDAIFTLNQDTLLEMQYLNNVAAPAEDRYWQGACLPGMETAYYLRAIQRWRIAGGEAGGTGETAVSSLIFGTVGHHKSAAQYQAAQNTQARATGVFGRVL